MASLAERRSVAAARADIDRELSAAGHHMHWEYGCNALRRGYAYTVHGTCSDCAAEITVGFCWTSCPSVRDARKVDCSGPGTHVLTDIEARHSHDLVAAAVADFGRAVAVQLRLGETGGEQR